MDLPTFETITVLPPSPEPFPLTEDDDDIEDTPLVVDCPECGGAGVVDFFSKKKPCEVCS